jgi:hypothetical protein
MRTKKGIFVIAFILAIAFHSCKSGQNNQEKDQSKSVTLEEKISLPVGFVIKYKIIKEEDLSYNGIKRFQYRITIPSTLNKEDVENNIKQIVLSNYKRFQLDGISILVFEEGDFISGAYTVAMGEFAPFGDWSKIEKNKPLQSYELKIEYKEKYFQPKEITLDKGSIVTLYKDKEWNIDQKKFVKATSVPLSNSTREWNKENIIIKIPNNTSAKILDVYKEKLIDDSEFIRYKVTVTYQGKKYEGWINNEEVKK